MADAADTMRYLVKSIDIAPAGTREEGQASKNLSKIFHEHGLESAEQNFKYSSFGDVPQAACLGLLGIVSLISGVASGAFLVVLFILGLVLAALYVLELYGIKTVSHIGMSGSSQNVIARHPAASTMNGQKARPVVIIAHYDTPRSDILSTPVVAGFRQYIRTAVLVCAIADVVAMFLQVLPLPTPVQSVAYAVAVIASVALVAWTVCVVLQRFVMPFSPAANDNKASIAAMFGLLDRVRPLRGGVGSGPSDALRDAMGFDDGSSIYTAVEDPDAARVKVSSRNHSVVEEEEGYVEDEAAPSRPRRSRASRLRAKGPVRYGAEVVKSLGILPESCAIEYEAPQAEEAAVKVPASVSGKVHHVGVGSEASRNATVAVNGETLLMAPVSAPDATSEQQPTSSATGEDVAPAAPVQVDPEAIKDAAAEAIMAGIVGVNTLSGSQAPDPSANGATSFIQPVGQNAQGAQGAQTIQPVQPFNVITSSDDFDVELSGGVSQMPLDVAAQTAQEASSYIVDDFDSPSANVVNSPEWGTSNFVPVTTNRSILGNIPDPAVAAVDPFSVSSIETVGNYNPDDFSELDFETGTHQAVTPNMLEYERRRALDGFSADITENSGKRGRKGKGSKGRRGRIGHQAAQMQQQMQESSFNDWLGLDENYDAKTNGEQIGSWDNFADDGSTVQQPGQPGQYGQQNGQYGQQPNPRWQGGAARARRAPRREGEEAVDAVETRRAAMTLGDRDLIAHEIWFVLTGASEAGHAGVEDFLKMYRQDLRGAYFINLECVGAGKPSLIIEEGLGRHVKADRRLVNLFGNASLGINRPLALARMGWSDTEASTLLRQGCRAVSVVGIEKGAPAHARWVADTPDKVNLEQINDLVDILVEVIKEA